MRCACYSLVVVLLVAGCGYGGGGGGVQGEVDFSIENRLEEVRYVNWAHLWDNLVSCQVDGGGVMEDCRFHPPGCRFECAPDNLQENCCLQCEQAYPSVKIIDPGGTLTVPWSGKLHPLDETHCSDCECYRVEDAAPGSYRAEVCVYAEYFCDWEPCEGPDADGVIMGASPDGTPTCYAVDFTVNYTKAFLILAIE